VARLIDDRLTRALFQTISHLKMVLHFLVGIVLGLNYYRSGNDGSKTISNVGFFIISTVYLAYTSLMPAVLKCN
jgi:ATP-binding cassette subfamily G (WHITE) protein 1